MTRTTGRRVAGRLAALSVILLLAACVREPFLPPQYVEPAPPPLQPYMGPPIAAPAVAAKRVVKRHYVRKRRHYRHRRVRCRCVPIR